MNQRFKEVCFLTWVLIANGFLMAVLVTWDLWDYVAETFRSIRWALWRLWRKGY